MKIDIHSDRITVNRPGYGPNIIASIVGHMKSTIYSADMNNAYTAMRSGAEQSNKMLEMQHPSVQVVDYYRRNHVPAIARNIRSVQQRAIKEDKAINETYMNGLLTDRPISEVRAMMLHMQLSNKKPSDVIKLAMQDRMIAAFAIVDETNANLFGIPEAGREQLLRNIWRINAERAYSKTVASAPTLDDLLGREVRNSEAETLAKQAETELDNRRSELGNVVKWTHDAINHVAVMSDTSPQHVFTMMQDAKTPAAAPVISPPATDDWSHILPLNAT